MNDTTAECLKVPVVVGVTGHIDIAQEESWILEQLAHFWEKVREIVGEQTPIVLLSSIAQGADHYVVKSMPEGIKRYCVVLPFARVDYEQDFVKYAMTPNALEEFREDLAGAYKVIQCNGKVGDYAVASDYVRSRSDILITLWDGYESLNEDGTPKRGGTYHQIRIACGLDEAPIPQQEKAHVVVNLTISRKTKHSEAEKCVCRLAGKPTLNLITYDHESNEFSALPIDAEWRANA